MVSYSLKMIGQFVEDMKKQKLRCFLTMSGITWGTMAVILLLSLGDSFRRKSIENMSGMGANIVILGGGMTKLPYKGMTPGRSINLTSDEADLVREHVPHVASLSPEIEQWVTMSRGRERMSTRIVGVYPEYSILRNLFPRPGGRFVDPLDMENKRRVVFLGNDIADRLFEDGVKPVGETVFVNDTPFTVIGVMESKVQNSSYMTQDRLIPFMPFTTASEMFGTKYVNRIIYRADESIHTPYTRDAIYELLGRRKGFDPADTDALWMWDTSELMQYLHYFFLGFQVFLLAGGVLTLVVGGIGVANIMYVAIRERRREIGIKTAIGATPNLILSQFMLESFIIMLIGGGLGIAGAWAIVSVISVPALSQLHDVMGVPVIDLPIALITAGILALIGFAAGWSPARRAAEMEPVQALEF